MNSPKVSVIIPNYNHARFLEKRIRSVLNQTCQDFEVIYLDDASTDNSAEIFAKFIDDRRIRAIVNPVNSGSPFKQWNKGVREAIGEYIWIAESDDYADERLLKMLVEQLDTHPTVGVTYCQSWEVDEHDHILSKFEELYTANLVDPDRWKTSFTNHGQDECRRYLILYNTIPNASAVLIRRSAYLAVGGAPEDKRLCGDWLFWSKVLLVSDVAYVAEPLNYFRRHLATTRERFIENGVSVEEAFQVLRYICRNTEVPKDRLEQAVLRFVDLWLPYVFWHSVPWSRNIAIYNMAKELQPNMNMLLLRKIGTAFFTDTAGYIIRIIKLCFGIERPLKEIFQQYMRLK